MNSKAIVFDLDDTLYLERNFVRSGFRAVGEWFRAEFGMSDFARRAATDFLAGKRGHIFDDVLASYGMNADLMLVDRLVTVYREHFPSIRLLEDARACLNALEGTYPLALITDGSSTTQRNKIRALGIEKVFDTIIVTGELGVGHSKPNPLAFCLVEERLGLHGAELAYIGDNPQKDFQAAIQLGWQTVWVERPRGIYFGSQACCLTDHRIIDLRLLLTMLPFSPEGIRQ